MPNRPREAMVTVMQGQETQHAHGTGSTVPAYPFFTQPFSFERLVGNCFFQVLSTVLRKVAGKAVAVLTTR